VAALTKKQVSSMNSHNYLLIGSFAAFALLGNNVGLAQSGAPTPQHISGGDAEFTPLLQPYTATTSDGTPAQPTILFPLPTIPGHPAIYIVAKSPAFVSHGSFFFPLSTHSQPAKNGDFILLGEIVYSFPQDNLSVVFSDFRLDTNGSVFAKISVNGSEPFGSETELLTAKTISSTATATQFRETGKEEISEAFASDVNSLFKATVLTPGEELAVLHLDADIAK
jgi:hypothetical protein